MYEMECGKCLDTAETDWFPWALQLFTLQAELRNKWEQFSAGLLDSGRSYHPPGPVLKNLTMLNGLESGGTS